MRAISQRFSIQHLWALVILAGIFVFVNTHPIRPHDFWWHMAVGRDLLVDGKLQSSDTYSYTAYGAAYPSYQSFWLMEIILYGIYRTGGAALVVFFQSLVVTGAYFLIFLTCLIQSNNWRAAAFGTAFAAALGMNDWNVRPQVITFLLGAVFLFLIQQLQRGSRRWWAALFPLLMVFWVNSHGSFPLGIFFLCLWLGQEVWDFVQARREDRKRVTTSRLLIPLVTLITTMLACLANPAGIGILHYQQNLWKNSIIQNLVVEWAPPTFSSLGGGIFLTGLVVSALILALSPRRVTFYQLAGYVVMAYLALQTSRGIIWFGLVLAPAVAEHAAAVWGQLRGGLKPSGTTSGKPVLNWVFLAAILAVAVITLPWFKEQVPMPEAKAGLISLETPVQATQYLLEADPPGNLFHAMSFGSYLVWEAYPEYRVFVDGRIELYPEEIWVDYLIISYAMADWQADLDAYGVHTLMLSRSEQAGLVEAVMCSDRWKLVYEDSTALIFIQQ